MKKDSAGKPEKVAGVGVGFALGGAFIMLLVGGAIALMVANFFASTAVVSTPASLGESGAEATPLPTVSGSEKTDTCPILSASPGMIPLSVEPWDVINVGESLLVPSSAVGPAIETGISRCFAHNSRGGLYAAANWLIWMSSQQQKLVVAEMLIAPGPARDRAFVEAEASCGDDGSNCLSEPPIDIRGFKIAEASENEMLVYLAVSQQTDPFTVVSFQVPLRWDEKAADWLVVMPEINSWGVEPIQSLNLEGFTLWGEVPGV